MGVEREGTRAENEGKNAEPVPERGDEVRSKDEPEAPKEGDIEPIALLFALNTLLCLMKSGVEGRRGGLRGRRGEVVSTGQTAKIHKSEITRPSATQRELGKL